MDSIKPEIREIIRDSYPQIKELNPAQQAVIDAGLLEDNHNYIIAIPTASGKTLLGVMAALDAMLNGGKVVYAVPLISIQNEKIKEFKAFEAFNIKVGRHPSTCDLAVMVFESFDSITRFNWNTLRDVDLLIVDEFHMIGEYSRGPTIECALTRSHILNPGMRIIALSATLKNMNELATWLDAHVIEHVFRPVPLYKDVLNTEEMELKNKNDVILRVLKHSIEESSQILVFVATRRFTESLANYTSNKIKKNVSPDKKSEFQRVADEILEVPKRRGTRPTNTCLKLAESIRNGGIAYHHAGLFDKQREIIEDEFRNGNLLMITATPSLMYGVNLPSKNVIIRDYTRWTSQGPQPIPVFDYEQMSGRAGRPGYDEEGYSYLIAKNLEESYNLKDHYIYGEIEATNSRLLENKDAVYRQIIAQVASSLAKTPDDLKEFFHQTFYGFQMCNNPILNAYTAESMDYEVEEALKFLLKNNLLQLTPNGLKTTQLGTLVSRTNYSIETAVRLKEYATQTPALDIYNLIHMITKTPDIIPITFKGRKSKEPVRDKLNNKGIFAVEIGASEATAAALIEWIEEHTEYEIENAFNVYAASTRRTAYDASLLVKFFKEICEIQNIYNYTPELEKLSSRLYYGVKEELIPLVVGIKRLGRKRARTLVNTFGTDFSNLTIHDLTRVEGIGPKIAETITQKYNKIK